MIENSSENKNGHAVLFKTVQGISIGAVSGFIANAIVETACASIVAKKLKLPSIEHALISSPTTVAISMGLCGYQSYQKEINRKSNSREIQF